VSESIDDEPTEESGYPFQTWSEYEIFLQPDGTYLVRFSTNDDDDDGVEDAEGIVNAEYTLPSLDRALKFTGVTKRGAYGQPVKVLYQGNEFTSEEQARELDADYRKRVAALHNSLLPPRDKSI
jgi:hypothetical protein